jgi:hypothetical protein
MPEGLSRGYVLHMPIQEIMVGSSDARSMQEIILSFTDDVDKLLVAFSPL